ncbi:glycoside hydrolase family 55 protein [Lipomyces orientalis]|uniref:Glycoside hydrolase family 55 protein n=1 Tax=Lipomyces orientalis TaxID=1233043 RepID=A0ACC3TFT7_9ASCO
MGNNSLPLDTDLPQYFIDEPLDEDRSGLTPTFPAQFWREGIEQNGVPAFLNDNSFPVWRNVKDAEYGATGDGNSDDTQSIQRAINAGSATQWRYDGGELTIRPALVYIPGGTYRITKTLTSLINTMIIGDPLNPPTLIADSSLGTNSIIWASDQRQPATNQFFQVIRNIHFDTTRIAASVRANALNWPVSQACQLLNVNITMPDYSQHVGIQMVGGNDMTGGSGTILGDMTITGGGIGILLNNQQYNFKTIVFNGCNVAISIAHVFSLFMQGLTFLNCEIGIDTQGSTGSISLIDSTANFVGTVINAHYFGDGNGSLVVERLAIQNSGSTVYLDNQKRVVISGSISDTWVMGNAYIPGGPNTGAFQSSSNYSVQRSPSLVNSAGDFCLMTQPQYQDYDSSQFVNVRSLGAIGDGIFDDTATIQEILNSAAGSKIVYVPQGTYSISDTLMVPPGTRIVGEVWSGLSASGPNFADASNPRPLLKIGNTGEVGVAQISDMLLTTADVLPGAILMEVNMAGFQPGDVGMWNTHFRIGGSAQTKVYIDCAAENTENCRAAFAMLHVTPSGSPYIENMWGWTADHSLDSGGNNQNIATGRGALIEGTVATWMVGTAFEHNTLYQYNINNARNVFIGMQQTETPYWQGLGSLNNAPQPWTFNLTYGDPTYANCVQFTSNQQCYMAWAQHVSGGSNLYIYNSALWSFFNGMNNGDYSSKSCKVCQLNMAYITSAPSNFYWYNVDTLGATNMIEDEYFVAARYWNPGGWDGAIAAYLRHGSLGV